jgi:transcriptional regulator with XRE-family HTH domain
MEMKTCTRCSHVWLPRMIGKDPVRCPGCNSPYWNKPRRIVDEVSMDERLNRMARFKFILKEKGISAEQAAMITGKSVTTIYKYTKVAGLRVPVDVLTKLEKFDISPDASRQFKCAISGCGHSWVGRSAVPPTSCPKCHNKHWISGLSPVEAKGALRRMMNAVGSLRDISIAADVPEAKLLPYLQGKPMTKEQLDHLNTVLKAKGFVFRYLN